MEGYKRWKVMNEVAASNFLKRVIVFFLVVRSCFEKVSCSYFDIPFFDNLLLLVEYLCKWHTVMCCSWVQFSFGCLSIVCSGLYTVVYFLILDIFLLVNENGLSLNGCPLKIPHS